MDTSQHYSGLVYHPQPQHVADSAPPQSYPQNMAWQVPQHSPPSSSASGHVQMQSMMPHSQDHVEYAPPSAQQSFLSRHVQDFSQPHLSSPSVDSSSSSNLMSFDSPQIPGSIGPDRGLSRRRPRPPSTVQSHGELPEYAPMPEVHDPVQHSQYPSQQDSRPQSPISLAEQYDHARFINYPTPTGYYHRESHITYRMPPGVPSPRLPSVSSSTSSMSNPRSASPALSTASALTSLSAESVVPPQPREVSVPYESIGLQKENKKRRLYNVDRRNICQYAHDHPDLKQEVIARFFQVERSTVSKILKQRQRWLNISANEEVQIAKMRPTKFPELEFRLSEWVKTVSKNGTVLSDAVLRSKAREIGDQHGYTPEKFKASSGWLENFKHRHGIKRGVWTGSGLAAVKARAYGEDFQPPVPEHCPPGPFARTATPSEDGPSRTGYSVDGSGQVRSTHQGIQAMHPSASLNLQPAWPRTNEPASNDGASSSGLMYPSGGQSSYSLSQDTAAENEQPVVEAAMPTAEPVAISLGPEDGGEGEQVYVVPVMPEILEGEDVPDVAEAEKAIDKVLAYARANHGELELGDPGFQLLLELKYKLFGKATGQPFDSRYMPKHASS